MCNPVVKWPRHDATLLLTHNMHKSYYQTLASAIFNDCCDVYPDGAFIDADDKAACIANDDVWTLQVYPDTPVGYYIKHASTFEKLMAAVNEE